MRALLVVACFALVAGCTAFEQRATLGGPGTPCAPRSYASFTTDPALFDALSAQPGVERLFHATAMGAPLPQWVERYGEHQVQIVQWRPDGVTLVDMTAPGFHGETDRVVVDVYARAGTTPAEVAALAERFARMAGFPDPPAVARAVEGAHALGTWESNGLGGPSYQIEIPQAPDVAPLLEQLDAQPTVKEFRGGAVTLSWSEWRVALALPIVRESRDGLVLQVASDGTAQASAWLAPGDAPWPSLQERVAMEYARLGLPPPDFAGWTGNSGC